MVPVCNASAEHKGNADSAAYAIEGMVVFGSLCSLEWAGRMATIYARAIIDITRQMVADPRWNKDSLMEKNKALDAAVAQIERAFGKGSIMRMGSRGPGRAYRGRSRPARSGSIWRSASAGCRAGGSSRSTVRKAPARPRWRCTRSPRRRSAAAPAPSSMPSTRWTRLRPQARRGRRQPADQPAGRRRAGAGDLPTRWCARARSTWW